MRDFFAELPLGSWIQSPWFLGPAVFVLWTLLFVLVKKYLLNVLRRLAARSSWTWDDVIVRALSGPLLLPIFASGLLIFERILPLSREWDRAFDIVMAGAMALTLVLFVDIACRGVLDRLADKHPVLRGTRGLIQGLIRGLLVALGLLVFLDSIGISITPILASLGIGSLAVALALKDSLANLFAGFQMILDKSVEPGHFIRLEGGMEGTVSKMGWRTTRILISGNNTVVVPNAKLTESIITNVSLPGPDLDASLELGVHFDSDLGKVERVALEVAKEVQRSHPGAVRDVEPRIRFTAFGDSGIDLQILVRARNVEGSIEIRHELIKRIHARFAREEILIPFPTRTLDLPPERSESLRGSFLSGSDGPADIASEPSSGDG
jgi:small-conductance mechanosensitive channel